MAQGEVNLDHDIPLLTLPPYWAKIIVGLFSIICFVNSYDGDFVFDDSEAIINNKVSDVLLIPLAVLLLRPGGFPEAQEAKRGVLGCVCWGHSIFCLLGLREASWEQKWPPRYLPRGPGG
uniref:Uncharacterized protein n=1 Tax=Naja naja TaxID=35670 RepID=A0A8C6YHY3_NAJNA